MLNYEASDGNIYPVYLDYVRGALTEIRNVREATRVMMEKGIRLEMAGYRTVYNFENIGEPVCGSFGCILGNMAHLDGIDPELNITADDIANTRSADLPYLTYAHRITKHLYDLKFPFNAELDEEEDYREDADAWNYLFGGSNPNCYDAFLDRLDEIETMLVQAGKELKGKNREL